MACHIGGGLPWFRATLNLTCQNMRYGWIGAVTSAATNNPMQRYIFPGVPSGDARNCSGAPASLRLTNNSRFVPAGNAVSAFVSEPKNEVVNLEVVDVVTATEVSYTPTASTSLHPPNTSPAAGVAATRISIPTRIETAHCTSSPPAPASALSKSQKLSYAGTNFVTPSTASSICATALREANAGNETKSTPASVSTVTLCFVSAHDPCHGQMPMSYSVPS
mmetsp:Transcript_12419/g.41298  ORF Transcript_12419/g.41298 Transcript_12419/m.41298 type:complete len:221 (+) Transcript_12419:141-803(+)